MQSILLSEAQYPADVSLVEAHIKDCTLKRRVQCLLIQILPRQVIFVGPDTQVLERSGFSGSIGAT
jgi:hypothetical protein